jgi:hypothetical protein
MRRMLLTLALVLGLAPQAQAAWNFDLGIGEQQAAMFDDPRFLALGLEHARVVTAYDVACRAGADRYSLDTWLTGAQRAGVRPLVGFSFSSAEGQRWKLPSYRRFLSCFRAFRARYPQVHDFNPWNEANHSSQPTYRHPKKAAGFYNAMRRACPRCTVAAGDLLDWSHLVRWLERYRPHLRGRPRLWSMHNYLDVNRPRTWRASGTRKVLRMTRGRLWITETAGVVASRRYSKYDEQRAADATRRMFAFAGRSPRITRLYGYQWQAGCDPYGWDSAWFRSNGSARPAWRVVVDEIARERGLDSAEVEALDPPLSAAMNDTCKGSSIPPPVE